jgi:hypothetical protein
LLDPFSIEIRAVPALQINKPPLAVSKTDFCVNLTNRRISNVEIALQRSAEFEGTRERRSLAQVIPCCKRTYTEAGGLT